MTAMQRRTSALCVSETPGVTAARVIGQRSTQRTAVYEHKEGLKIETGRRATHNTHSVEWKHSVGAIWDGASAVCGTHKDDTIRNHWDG